MIENQSIDKEILNSIITIIKEAIAETRNILNKIINTDNDKNI